MAPFGSLLVAVATPLRACTSLTAVEHGYGTRRVLRGMVGQCSHGPLSHIGQSLQNSRRTPQSFLEMSVDEASPPTVRQRILEDAEDFHSPLAVMQLHARSEGQTQG